MTTRTDTETGTSGSRSSSGGSGSSSEPGGPIRISGEDVRGAIDSVSRSVPEVARTSRSLMDDAMRGIEGASDERVAAGVTLSLGLAVGLLIGGAPRLLIALAMIPLAAMGIVMMDRRRGASGGARNAATAGRGA